MILRNSCPDTEAVRDSLIIGVPDGDAECATLAGAALSLLGFNDADLQAAAAGSTVDRADYSLTVLRVTDGILLGIDFDR